MTDSCLVVRRSGPVAELTLNRPNVMNALNHALISALSDTVRDLSDDPELRAIILTGLGRAFCAGLDLRELSETPGAMERMEWHGGASLFDLVRACPHPIIAAVNGHAVTGGLELAMMADFMIASEEAKFADTHARVGITPGWGMSQVLPRLIGANRARQMSLTGEFINARTAYDWGLVNEVLPADDLMPRARALAAQIAETDRVTMGRLRGLINDSQDMGLADGLRREVTLFDDHIAGVTPDKVSETRTQVTARGRAIAGQQGEQG